MASAAPAPPRAHTTATTATTLTTHSLSPPARLLPLPPGLSARSHRTLKTANRDLAGHLSGVEASGERARGDLAAFRKEGSNEVLGANNAIAALVRRLERAEAGAKAKAAELDGAVAGGSAKTRELGQVGSMPPPHPPARTHTPPFRRDGAR